MTKIPTELTRVNINLVLEHLSGVPKKLNSLCKPYSDEQARTVVSQGKRSLIGEVRHLLNCEARASEAICLALVLKEPSITSIHPERQWGELISYEELSFATLLTYFEVRRAILVSVLQSLPETSWQRVVQESGKKRKESVYWKARALVLHECHHLELIDTRFSNRC